MKIYQISIVLYQYLCRHKWPVFALVIALIFFNIWGKQFFKSYHLYRALHDKNALLVQRLETSRLSLSQKQHFVHKAETQSGFREKLIREHLGFIKKQEYVIRFLTPESDEANAQQAIHF
ncbi:MAG: hypothetical protein LBE99_02595 [Puniceicoccales bacterium]|nr:hypothetical protein [Puniceicoccales bacterium]